MVGALMKDIDADRSFFVGCFCCFVELTNNRYNVSIAVRYLYETFTYRRSLHILIKSAEAQLRTCLSDDNAFYLY